MKSLSTVELEALIRREFPSLHLDSDPDVERYFDLRKMGRHQEALDVYKYKLTRRYPESNRRVQLLGAFRKRDGNFTLLLREAMLDYAQRLVDQLKANVSVIVAPIEGIRLDNAYQTIRAVERIIAMLPKDRLLAMEALERLLRFSTAFHFRESAMEKAYNLVREYFLEAGFEETLDQFIEKKRVEREAHSKTAKNHQHKLFDLSKIKFSAEDIARILIPETITVKEEKVVAFCYKYWFLVDDPGMERTIFLYSRKHKTPHYDVFKAIKRGRANRHSDEEILNGISNALTTGYSYSVQGDRYLQSAWKKLKEKLYPKAPALNRETLEKAATAELPTQAADLSANDMLFDSSGKPIVNAPLLNAPPPTPDAQKPRNRRQKKGKKAASTKARNAARSAVGKGGVSDKIKRLSGQAYDVYKDIFLSRVRLSIRGYLSENKTKSHKLFDSALNDAEEICYQFIVKNYDNPYMDWEGSNDKISAENLGFSIPNLDWIIERCYRTL